jgi:hypothetical protein
MEPENSDPCFEPDESNAHPKHYVHQKVSFKIFICISDVVNLLT